MPQVELTQAKAGKKLPIVVGLVAVLVVCGVVVLMLKMNQKPVPPPPKTSAVLSEAQNLSFLQKYDQAIQILHNQLPFAKNNQERGQIYLAIGAADANKGDMQAAETAYEKAAGLVPGFGSDDAVAQVAVQTGDKVTALEYYKKEEALITSGQDKHDAYELDSVKAEIQQLGGTP